MLPGGTKDSLGQSPAAACTPSQDTAAQLLTTSSRIHSSHDIALVSLASVACTSCGPLLSQPAARLLPLPCPHVLRAKQDPGAGLSAHSAQPHGDAQSRFPTAQHNHGYAQGALPSIC